MASAKRMQFVKISMVLTCVIAKEAIISTARSVLVRTLSSSSLFNKENSDLEIVSFRNGNSFFVLPAQSLQVASG